jgi:hypothetical protein
VLRLRISGAIPLLPIYAFMAWRVTTFIKMQAYEFKLGSFLIISKAFKRSSKLKFGHKKGQHLETTQKWDTCQMNRGLWFVYYGCRV